MKKIDVETFLEMLLNKSFRIVSVLTVLVLVEFNSRFNVFDLTALSSSGIFGLAGNKFTDIVPLIFPVGPVVYVISY